MQGINKSEHILCISLGSSTSSGCIINYLARQGGCKQTFHSHFITMPSLGTKWFGCDFKNTQYFTMAERGKETTV